MYGIQSTKTYRKSYKRALRHKNFDTVLLDEVIDKLAHGKKLENKYRDHQLTGELQDCRECHIKGDLLLVYRIRKNELLLVLVDIGTHSYLGL